MAGQVNRAELRGVVCTRSKSEVAAGQGVVGTQSDDADVTVVDGVVTNVLCSLIQRNERFATVELDVTHGHRRIEIDRSGRDLGGEGCI